MGKTAVAELPAQALPTWLNLRIRVKGQRIESTSLSAFLEH
jgi:hypothetical protein